MTKIFLAFALLLICATLLQKSPSPSNLSIKPVMASPLEKN